MTDIPDRGHKPPVGFTRHEAVINGTRTVLYAGGEGPPFLFLHGGGTFHGIDFAREWTEHFKMILPYHPGMGETAGDPGFNSMDAYLAHYEALLEMLGIEELYLGGISMGGWMAAEFALAFPDKVKKLVLVAPSGIFDATVAIPDLGAIPPDQLLSYLANDPSVFEPYLPKTEAEAAAFGEMLAGEGQTMVRFAPQGPFRPGLEDEVGDLDMPVLLLWGKQDRTLPPALAGAWQKAQPGIEVKLFDNAGHVLLDESAAARQAVVDFLEG